MKDNLGERMKSYYEDRTRFSLTRRTYTIIRIDGKAFHSYTAKLKKPFDDDLMEDMDRTAEYLCKNIQGAKFAFVQSDEISILLTDFDDIDTQAWFDNNLQKMCSISASLATSIFNAIRTKRQLIDELGTQCNAGSDIEKDIRVDNRNFDIIVKLPTNNLAHFDSRVFQIPTKTEVENYFIWRQQDTVRNSISSVAQSLYSPKQLHGKNSSELQEMIFQKGINWNDYAAKYKRGRMIVKVEYDEPYNSHIPIFRKFNDNVIMPKTVKRSKWETIDVPIFTQEREFLTSKIPVND